MGQSGGVATGPFLRGLEDAMGSEMGERFAQAIAGRDAEALMTLLSPEIDFLAMTPNRVWEAASAEPLVDDVSLGKWFGDTDHIDALESIDASTVVDRHRVGYRFRVTNPDGTFAVEQQAYYGVANDQINWLRIMCSRYRPIQDPSVSG